MADAMHPLLAEFITCLFNMVSIADQIFESRFKMLTKVDEVFGVDVEALQDAGQVVRDVAFFVFSENTSTPVRQVADSQ